MAQSPSSPPSPLAFFKFSLGGAARRPLARPQFELMSVAGDYADRMRSDSQADDDLSQNLPPWFPPSLPALSPYLHVLTPVALLLLVFLAFFPLVDNQPTVVFIPYVPPAPRPAMRGAASILLGLGLLTPFFDLQVNAQSGPTDWTISPFNPPAVPIAVRSPALNSWLSQGNSPGSAADLWANILNPDHVTGWYASVNVDGTAYRVFGDAPISNSTAANLTAVEWTATQTTFVYTAGTMDINCTFISPITPTDLVRQSMPWSYFTMDATSNDGDSHNLTMYSDISGEFIAGDISAIAEWNSTDDGEYIILSMTLQNPLAFSEFDNVPQDATEYYSFKRISGTTAFWEITEDTVNRGMAANGTALGNKQDSTPRAVENDWPVLGIQVAWGSIQSTSEPAVFALGIMRSPTVQYRTSTGSIQDRYPYYLSVYGDGISASEFVLDDYSNALSASNTMDSQIRSDANNVSSSYADVVSLAARQVFGTLDITISRDGSGNWNTSDLMVFMKNYGTYGSDSGGTTQSINTVDAMFAAFPALLYANPELGGGLLRPLLEYMDSSAFTLSYSAKNIGSAYPNATADGINTGHDYGIEETANMIIMTLAYSQRSGNGTFISNHYSMLRSWAEYLTNNSLTPSNQRSADYWSSSDASENNQTNIAIKGIIGIAAMAKMAEIADVSSDRSTFNNTANSYLAQWQSNAVASDNSHIDFYYTDSNSNGLIYNMYADKLLQLDLLSDAVYQVATVFYNNIASQNSYGLALDSDDSSRSSVAAMMLSAATVTNTATLDYMITQVWDYASSNLNQSQFAVIYNPSNGEPVSSAAGVNSPAIGGVFSFMALNSTIKNIDIPSLANGSSSGSSSSNAGAIAGGVVGGLAAFALIGVGAWWFLRRKRLREQGLYNTRADPILDISNHPSSKPSSTGWHATSFTHEPFIYNNNGYGPPGTQPPQLSPGLSTRELEYGALAGAGAAAAAGTGATNARDSTYFRTHRPGESDDIGPSVSQVGTTLTGSGSGSGARGRGRGSSAGSQGGSSASHALLAKQALVNDELRSEVDNLRRDLERIREERLAAGAGGSNNGDFPEHDLPPPQYSDA